MGICLSSDDDSTVKPATTTKSKLTSQSTASSYGAMLSPTSSRSDNYKGSDEAARVRAVVLEKRAALSSPPSASSSASSSPTSTLSLSTAARLEQLKSQRQASRPQKNASAVDGLHDAGYSLAKEAERIRSGTPR